MTEMITKLHKAHPNQFQNVDSVIFSRLNSSAQYFMLEAKELSCSNSLSPVSGKPPKGLNDYLAGLAGLYQVSKDQSLVSGAAKLKSALEKGYLKAYYFLYIAYWEGRGVMKSPGEADRCLDAIIEMADRDDTFCVERI